MVEKASGASGRLKLKMESLRSVWVGICGLWKMAAARMTAADKMAAVRLGGD